MISHTSWSKPREPTVSGPTPRAGIARRYGFNRRTLQDWEQRRRRPAGPARLLLQIIDRAPQLVARILVERL